METVSKNKLLFTIIILLILINVSTLSFMWYWKIKEPPLPPPPMMEPPVKGPPPEARAHLKELLNLTDAQMETIDKIRESHIGQVQKTRGELKGLKDKIFSNLSNANADTNSVRDIANQIGVLEARVDLITFDNFREVRKVCTDEQKKKFDEVYMDFLRMGGPPPPGMHPGGHPGGFRPRDGDGHVNPPGMPGPNGEKPPPNQQKPPVK